MQTKKRAKPVKFGIKAKEEAEKKQLKAEAAVDEPKIVETPTEEEVTPSTPQNTELVDKLSDVPFETDFGTPNEEPTKPVHAEPARPAKAAAPEPEPEFTATSTNPAEPEEEELAKPISPEPIVTEPEPVSSSGSSSSIPPIGRANEPIPFNPHETVFNTPPDAGEKKRNPFVFFIIIALVAFLTGLAFMAGIYYAMPNKNLFAMPSLPSLPSLPALPGVTQPTPTPQLSAKASPTTAPSPEVKLSDYSVKVLNGSGVSGQAAKVKAALEAEGFTVASTGNAASNDFAKTQVTYQKRVSKDALNKVITVLKKSYVVEKETELPTTATKESDITITIGKETAK